MDNPIPPGDTNETPPILPAVIPPSEMQEVQEGVPIPYKVPDYEDSIPIGKSLAIVGGILGVVVGIFFLAKTSGSLDLQGASKDSVDFSKMNGGQQQRQQGQVAGAQSYGPPPPAKVSPTDKAAKTTPSPTTAENTPTPTQSPTPTPTKKPDDPTSTPTPTETPSPTPSPTGSPTPTPTSTITPSPSV